MKEVTVIIVNYRVKYFLEQTIKSVQESLIDISGEIIVIDNKSEDDSIDFLRPRFPNVQFIENAENVGFARANNQGINLADSVYTLILNPDTIISKQVLNDSINLMKSRPDCGGVGVKMIDGNGVFLPESKRAFPTPWVSFCKIFGLSFLFPNSPRFAKYHLRYLDKEEIHKIDILAGAYMFIRTDLLKELKGFDEDFFMYGEDIDLSFRITKKGYSNYYLPTPIIHYKGESTKKDSMKYVRVFYEAMLIFFRKHYPHYSIGYSVIIKGAVMARAFSAIMKRLICAPLKSLFPKSSNSMIKSIILSNNPDSINQLLKCDSYSSSSTTDILNDFYPSTKYEVIIDNSLFSYQEIISIIEKNVSKNINFHIYSHENDLIISPKMQVI